MFKYKDVFVKRIEKEDWKLLSKDSHVTVFKEEWDPEKERIDYALVTTDIDNQLIQYSTIRELDADTGYLQYGGSFPSYRGSVAAYRSFQAILRWLQAQYRYVSFLTENTNFPMLKFAIREGFVIVGMRVFKNHIMLEHFRDRGE